MNRILILTRYALDYFHAQIITILCFTIMCIYYIYCLFARYYVDADICMHSLIHNNLESGIFNTNNSASSNSLAHIGLIDLSIKEGKYEKAILLIEGLKSNIRDKTSKLYKMQSIRQAMLYMHQAKTITEYENILDNNLSEIDNDIKANLKNMFIQFESHNQ